MGEVPDSGGGDRDFLGKPRSRFRQRQHLQYQQMPLLIELNDPELCIPDAATKKKYQCKYSVNEECLLTVYPVISDA